MRIVNWVKSNPWLMLILAVAAFLRFYRADFQSIWLDEILSMNDANPNLTWNQFYDGIMFWEFIPHLFFALLRICFELFGFNTLVGRLFAGVIGIMGVYSIYLLGKEISNKRTGLIAAGLLTVNIYHIGFSQEIRPYGLLLLFTTLSFYRLVILIRKPTIRNAVFYGIFAGLIIHAHFFGLITLFAQGVIFLIFLWMKLPAERMKFLWQLVVGGVCALIVILPAIEPLIRMSEISSFWLPIPGPDAFSVLIKEFFGQSEWVLFVAQILLFYYAWLLFEHNNTQCKIRECTKSDINFNFLIILPWILISLLIPLLRSYLDVPMILTRYFINIVPAIILVMAISIDRIKNSLMIGTALFLLVLFSLTDLFVVKNYYGSISKTQFRELTTAMKAKDSDSKIVVYWSWLFPFFYNYDPSVMIEQKLLEDYVIGLKTGSIEMEPFWYADANSRPFTLSEEGHKFLNENFILEEDLQFFDAWGKLYVPKNTVDDHEYKLKLHKFRPRSVNEAGAIFLYENTTVISPVIDLKEGKYVLQIKGRSYPEKPVNGVNAHLTVKVNGAVIGDAFLSPQGETVSFPFVVNGKRFTRVQIIYDNDDVVNDADRNLEISSVLIQRN